MRASFFSSSAVACLLSPFKAFHPFPLNLATFSNLPSSSSSYVALRGRDNINFRLAQELCDKLVSIFRFFASASASFEFRLRREKEEREGEKISMHFDGAPKLESRVNYSQGTCISGMEKRVSWNAGFINYGGNIPQ